jgi:small conductance mechanosensitive channel
MENLTQMVKDLVTLWGIKFIVAVVILIVGIWIAKLLRNMAKKLLRKREIDETIVSFLGSLVYVAMVMVVIIAVLRQVGIETTSFIAIIGAAGLAIGFALQGSLSNFAAGILMLVFRPFKAGDFIEGGGTMGVVEKIHIFTTQLKTPDNKVVIVPNAKIMGDNITNYSAKDQRRVDLIFGISYGDDMKKAKKVMEDVLAKNERVLKDPAPTIGVVELGDSSVNIVCRPWVKTSEYWPVRFDITEKVKEAFDKEGISIPFPQRDVHVYQHTK